MASALLSNPTLISSPFVGQRLSIRGNSKKIEPCDLIFWSPRCSLDASYGVLSFRYQMHGSAIAVLGWSWNPRIMIFSCLFLGITGGNILRFSRMNIWNPYKRLGIPVDASEEEVWSARNFLLDQYAGHERSVESIEAAFEKLLMVSFKNRKKTKINLKTQLKKKVEESPPWVKNLLSFVEAPPSVIILRRLFLFSFMACWSVMNSAEAGPAFQVALSLAACIYFLNDKSKSLPRAAIFGFGALVVGWISGSLLIPLIPSSLLQPTWTLELLTSLVAYIFLFVACTFLK